MNAGKEIDLGKGIKTRPIPSWAGKSKRNWPGILLWGLVFLFLSLGVEVLNDKLVRFDQVIIGYLHFFNSLAITRVMKGITMMGSATVLIILALALLLYLYKRSKHHVAAKMVIVALAGSWLANELLKYLFQRNRPPEITRLVDASGFSFPSGHAMVSFAFYGLLIYLLWVSSGARHMKKLKYAGTALLVILILAIGVSRIYLGVHYPSDVLAGFAAGGAWLAGCIQTEKQ